MAEALTRILVVDDEDSVREFLQMGLGHEGYAVILAGSGSSALEEFRRQQPHLVILDWMLPDRDGLSVCRELRARSTVPILLLTARGELEDKVVGLDAGADDYLPKPFKFRELLARVRALLRRAGMNPAQALRFADLELDPGSRRVSRAGRPVELSQREFDLLELLLRHSHKVMSKEQILEHLWGWDFEGQANVVEVHVSALRAKLGDHDRRLIRTVRGVGYGLGG